MALWVGSDHSFRACGIGFRCLCCVLPLGMNGNMECDEFYGTVMNVEEWQVSTADFWPSCMYDIPPADVAVDIREGSCRLQEGTLHW